MSQSTKRFEVITLADGVSTCKAAREGAQIACEAVTDLLVEKGDFFLECEEEKTAEFVTSHILFELDARARESGEKTEEYSSTIASVLVDKKSRNLLFFSLGDSIILATVKGKCEMIAMPANSLYGCPVTTTKNAASVVKTGVLNAALFDSVLICSDGAWGQMLEGNRLREDVRNMLLSADYDGLGQFLDAKQAFDDYSFISIDLRSVDEG